MTELRGRLLALEAALVPFARFIDIVDKKPLAGVASPSLPDEKVLYAIHTGTPWAAEITLGHLRAARTALERP